MKTNTLLALAVVALSAAAYNLYAGTGANQLTGRDPYKTSLATPVNITTSIAYKGSVETPRFVQRANTNPTKVVVGTEQTVQMKCSLNGTPKSIALSGPTATMSCCPAQLAQCAAPSCCK